MEEYVGYFLLAGLFILVVVLPVMGMHQVSIGLCLWAIVGGSAWNIISWFMIEAKQPRIDPDLTYKEIERLKKEAAVESQRLQEQSQREIERYREAAQRTWDAENAMEEYKKQATMGEAQMRQWASIISQSGARGKLSLKREINGTEVRLECEVGSSQQHTAYNKPGGWKSG